MTKNSSYTYTKLKFTNPRTEIFLFIIWQLPISSFPTLATH